MLGTVRGDGGRRDANKREPPHFPLYASRSGAAYICPSCLCPATSSPLPLTHYLSPAASAAIGGSIVLARARSARARCFLSTGGRWVLSGANVTYLSSGKPGDIEVRATTSRIGPTRIQCKTTLRDKASSRVLSEASLDFQCYAQPQLKL